MIGQSVSLRVTASILVAAVALFAVSSAEARNGRGPLYGDPIDSETAEAALLLPGVPWIRSGNDRVLGTADDEIDPDTVGDIDLVIRAGEALVLGGERVPLPSPQRGAVPRGISEPFGQGRALPFSGFTTAADGIERVVPDYLAGLPLLVAVFGDLDGDGYIGITLLDGDPLDIAIERKELEALALRYAIFGSDAAIGEIPVPAAGPSGNPLRVALVGATLAGPLDKKVYEGVLPDGPAVVTRLPFMPITDPREVLRRGIYGVLPAMPEGRVAFQIRPAFEPDPAHPILGEAFTLVLDGSDPTIGVAEVVSGSAAGFAVALAAAPGALPLGRVRPGLGSAGEAVTLVFPTRLRVADDGEDSMLSARIVSVDTLGNVAEPIPQSVTLRSEGGVHIVSPDLDGDPTHEEIWIADARGSEIVLDDAGGRFDGADAGRLLIEGAERSASVALHLADPDVDEDGEVSERDREIVLACSGLALGDAGYDLRFDLNGDGSVGPHDVNEVARYLGESCTPDPLPLLRENGKGRKWKQPGLRKPAEARELKQLEKQIEALAKARAKAEEDARKQAEKDLSKAEKKALKQAKEAAKDLEKRLERLRKDYCKAK